VPLTETEKCYTQLLRLPLWVGMTEDMVERVLQVVVSALS
jgi:dTDP-4-amino-4,6-dideoxygalactose transaminase